MRAGVVVELGRAPVVNLRLALVAFLQLEIAGEKLDDGIVRHERRQLLHPLQRFRRVALLVARDRGENDRAVDAGDFSRDVIDDDRQSSEEKREEDDQHALELVRVGEEDHEPIEDEPHGTEP